MANADTKPSFLARFLPWAFGVTFLLGALALFSGFPSNATALFFCGLFLLPPVTRLITRLTKYAVPRWMVIVVGFVGMSALISVTEKESIAPASAPVVSDNAVPSQQVAAPAAPVSEEDQLRQIVSDVLKGNTNMNKSRLRKVDIVKQVAGGWGVFTEFNGDDNLTANMRKGGIQSQMAEVYIALYTSGKDLQTATVAAYFPLVDQYGNESEGLVLKTSLNKVEAAKVNWSADSSSLRRTILPNIWTTMLVHPEFR